MLTAGSTVSGRYRLTSLIGEGGMASVWRALDETLQRSVAIKLLYFRAHRDPRLMVEHFLREARIAASIQHRNVVNTVDFGTTEDGLPYMVMELLTGESLAARMEREPRLGMEEFVRLASLTLRGLAACHEAGIVHRDLKPANIFLQQQDDEGLYPKILDFGISRSLAASKLISVVETQQGLVIGTPHYMAPEQARGEAEIDKRADIYSMGAIIYEGITGQLPFDAPTPSELLVKIMSSVAPSMSSVRPDVPELLSDCVAQAMAHDREHRFVDARVFRRALQNAADQVFRHNAPVTSEVPELALADVRATAPQVANETKAAPAWGDFEGLGNRSDRPAAAVASSPPVARQQPSAPPVAPTRARSIPPPRAQSRPLSGPLAGSQPRAQSNTQAAGVRAPGSSAVDGPLLGDNPLDAFSEGSAAVDLDIDYGPAGGPGRPTAPGGPRASRPPPRGGRQVHATGHVVHAERKGQTSQQSSRPSALWILTALLALGVLVLLFAPQLFSAPPPDEAAAIQQEAQNPATRGSDRRLSASSSMRSRDLAKTPPALRDVP